MNIPLVKGLIRPKLIRLVQIPPANFSSPADMQKAESISQVLSWKFKPIFLPRLFLSAAANAASAAS